MIYLLVAMSLIVFFAVLTRPFIVLFHELGHAIPALIFTRLPVSVYLGSYGDPNRSFRVRLGSLDIWFGYKLIWLKGLCRHAYIEDRRKQAIVALMGPFASLVIAVVCAYFVFSYDMHGFLKMMIFCFLLFALFDLFTNLIPSYSPLRLYDGSSAYNDGFRLIQIAYGKRFPEEYKNAIDLYSAGKYDKAAPLFLRFIKMNFHNDLICRMAIYALCETGDLGNAYDINQILSQEYAMNDDDIATYKWIKDQMGISEV